MASETAAGSLLQRHLLVVAALCDARTSKGDCQVLAVIAGHAGRDGEAWPGVNRIASRAGIHRSTVLKSVERLQGWGYVEVHRERGRANVYRLATGSAHATSQTPELVAPTLPVRQVHQSHPRDPTSSADATGLVAPTLRDQSRPRYPNSAFELSHSNSVTELSSPAAPLSEEEEEQKRQQQIENIRAEYLEALKRDNVRHVRFMESQPRFRKHLEDLIQDRAA